MQSIETIKKDNRPKVSAKEVDKLQERIERLEKDLEWHTNQTWNEDMRAALMGICANFAPGTLQDLIDSAPVKIAFAVADECARLRAERAEKEKGE